MSSASFPIVDHAVAERLSWRIFPRVPHCTATRQIAADLLFPLRLAAFSNVVQA